MKRNDETQEEYEARIAIYQERKEAKADRFEELAEKHTKESDQAYTDGRRMTEGIPFGQPILVGHHSEKRHRNALKKRDAKMRKNIKHHDTAKYYTNRAAASRSNKTIYANDPEAIEKLKFKIETAERNQKRMKGINKIIRSKRKGYTLEQKKADVQKQFNFSAAIVEEIFKPDFAGRVGFPAYILSNNNANIKQMKTRLEYLLLLIEMEHKRYPVANGVDYEEDPAAARVRFYFPDKPADHIRKALKSHGFRWSPRIGAWQRQLTGNGQYKAQQLLPTLIEEYGEVQDA